VGWHGTGNNESAGKKKSGRTTQGNKQVKAVLTEIAWQQQGLKTHFIGKDTKTGSTTRQKTSLNSSRTFNPEVCLSYPER
jgi:hypothetical protein